MGIAISAALLPPVVNCGLCFALHFNVNENAEKFAPNYFLEISLYSGGLFILNILCIVICANLTFVLKKVNVANAVVITKNRERRRSEASSVPSYMNDDVSTYMHPTTPSRGNNSSVMNNLLGVCNVQNDRDLVRPLVHHREMKSKSRSTAEEEVKSSSDDSEVVL